MIIMINQQLLPCAGLCALRIYQHSTLRPPAYLWNEGAVSGLPASRYFTCQKGTLVQVGQILATQRKLWSEKVRFVPTRKEHWSQ